MMDQEFLLLAAVFLTGAIFGALAILAGLRLL